MDDFGEGFGVEAGSADEGSVDVLKAAEGSCVVGFDGAAVKDADGFGELGVEGFCDLRADDFVGLVGDLGGGSAAGADGPYGLVGEDDGRGVGGVDAFEGDGGLEFEHVAGEPGFALFEFFADADDGDEGMMKSGFELEVDGGVSLGEVLAALGVSDEDVSGSDGGEHDGRGLAGEGPLAFPVHVLGADEDGFAAGGVDERGERGHGRAEDDLGGGVFLDEGEEAGEEGGGLGGGFVHLPVGGYE